MTDGEAGASAPASEVFRAQVSRLQALWAFCSFSPLVYLALALALREWVLPSGGLLTLREPVYRASILGGLAGALAIGTLVTALRLAAIFRIGPATEPAARLAALRRRTFLSVGASECIALHGFILFLLFGELDPVFGFGVLSLTCYALSHPGGSAARLPAEAAAPR